MDLRVMKYGWARSMSTVTIFLSLCPLRRSISTDDHFFLWCESTSTDFFLLWIVSTVEIDRIFMYEDRCRHRVDVDIDRD